MQKVIVNRFNAHRTIVDIVVFGVAANGLFIIVSVLRETLLLHRRLSSGTSGIGLQLGIGLTLVYLSRLLSRRKRAAWNVVIPLYSFILGYYASRFVLSVVHDVDVSWLNAIKDILFPTIVVVGLLLTRALFNVKSDIQNFASSLRFIGLIFTITFFYGVIGFQLLDVRDFHQDLGLTSSIHYTIDQFDLTTKNQLIPHTQRARLFLDSLSIISIGAVGYGIISLFQPIKSRYVNQIHNRVAMRHLLSTHPANSEDFFKLWPHDKIYFLNEEANTGLAFKVHRGVALIIGDPAGNQAGFDTLLNDFDELCYVNDWDPAFIHVVPENRPLYRSHDFRLQKIGEEAILDLTHFTNNVRNNKYFRHIRNKFEKAGYTAELLLPPHSKHTINSLHEVSREWLNNPGRTERGLMMGYFTLAYIQQCPIMVARDNTGTIQAFINQVESFDKDEANYDMLRNKQNSLGNINDFVLLNFIDVLLDKGFQRLNLGLCPLSGLDNRIEDDKSVIDSALRFAYANGDLVYSFSGLHRFKAKYEPEWSDRYIAYRDGVSGFTRTINALNKAWKVSHIH